MTRFLVFRHGQSDANLKEYFAGWTDAALTPLGAEQARLAAEYVSRTEKPCCVWTSELTRAYLTGKAFADVCRIPIFRSAALNEIRAGRWEGVPFRDIKKLYLPDYSVWQNDVGNSRCTDGESVRELADRVGVSTSFIGHIERGEKKASVETIVALCNAMEVSPSALLQDSLSNAVMQSQLSFDEDSRELMNGLMQVLREHTERKEYK